MYRKPNPSPPDPSRPYANRVVRFTPSKAMKLADTMRQRASLLRRELAYEEAQFATRVYTYIKAECAPYDLTFTDDEWWAISRALRAADHLSLYRWIMKHGNYRADPGPRPR